MRVDALKFNQEVLIKLAHWVEPEHARVIGWEDEHCQLHGEFMHSSVRFRKIKKSGKESCMYLLAGHTEPEILQLCPAPRPSDDSLLQESPPGQRLRADPGAPGSETVHETQKGDTA